MIKDNSVSWATSICISCRAKFPRPPPAPAYIVSLIDSCSRLAWAEVINSKTTLPISSRRCR